MADPFLSQNVAGIYQELQRLRSENKELRLEVTTLRLRVQDQSLTAQAASSSSSNAPRKNSTKTTNASTRSSRVRDAEEDEQQVNTVGGSASQEMRDGQRSDAQTASSAREEQLTSPNSTRPATTTRRHSQQGTTSSPVNEELRHGRVVAEKEAAKYKAELKQVTAHFEAFITEVTEREAGYKAVYGGIYHELTEARAKCAGLQRQVQELESRLATAEQQRVKAATGVRVAAEPRTIAQVTNTPLQPTATSIKRQQQRRRQRDAAAEDTAPTRSSKEGESQVQKQQAASNPSVSASETATTATLDTTAKEIPAPASPFAMPPPVTITGDKPQTALHIAKGAAALRATNYDKLTQPRRTHQQRGVEGRRGREVHELVRPIAQPRYETPRSSLFARFQQNKADSALKTDGKNDISSTTTSKSVNDSSTTLHSASLAGPLASSSTTAKTAIHFGSDPIADFLRLHESTTVAHHRSRLAAELMRHFQQRYDAFAEAVVRHFIRSVHNTSSTATPSLSELWAKLEVMMGIAPESILPALTHAALSQLMQLLQGSLTAETANGGEEEMNVVDEEGQVGMTQGGLPLTSNIINSSVTVPPDSTARHTRQSERDVWWSERVAKVRLVALMLRLAYLQSASHSSPCHDQSYRCTSDTLLELFVTFTLGALRGWSDVVRRGTNTPSQASTSAMATLVQLWMTGVLALCGYQSSVQLFLRYYNVPEAAITSWVLPHALVCYTVQGIMRLCYMQCAAELQQRRRTTHWHVIRDAQGSSTLVVDECEAEEEGMTNVSPENEEEEQRERRCDSVWDCFCDALGWSTRQMPLDRLGEAAATLAVQPTSNREGLRRTCLQSLRCLVLYKGFSYVHTIREYLAHCAGPHGVADAIFAELLSYAVLDLRLADSRDAQWTQTIAFLDDYLNAAASVVSSPTSGSAQDSVSSSSSNQSLQGLVLRAILQLCASPLNETSVRVLSRAMRWVKSHTVHSNSSTTKEIAVPEIGRRLLQLIEQSS